MWAFTLGVVCFTAKMETKMADDGFYYFFLLMLGATNMCSKRKWYFMSSLFSLQIFCDWYILYIIGAWGLNSRLQAAQEKGIFAGRTGYVRWGCVCEPSFLSHLVLNDGTIIKTGITCQKTPCYMRESACRWFIVKKAKIFRSYVKLLWIVVDVSKYRILIGLCK